MKLTFLGTRGEIEARTRRHRMHSSLMISHGGADVMIDCGRFVLGEELRRFSNTQLELALDTTDIHFARVDAEQKMRIVAALKCKEHIVAGHRRWRKRLAGVALSRCGHRDGPHQHRRGTRISRHDPARRQFCLDRRGDRRGAHGLQKHPQISYQHSLTSNIHEIVPYLAFVLFRIPLPLTIIQILAVDLGTDMLPALALGTEEPDPDTMKKPPRPRAERLLNPALLARAYLFLGPMQAGVMAAFFFVLRFGAGIGVTCPAPMVRSTFRPRPRALARSWLCKSRTFSSAAANATRCTSDGS